MPRYLPFNGSNNYVSLANQINIGGGDDFSIRIRWPAAANSGNHRVLGGSSYGATSPRVMLTAGGNVTVYGSTGGNKAFSLGIDISVDRGLEIRRSSGQLGIYYDGVVQGATQDSTQSFIGFSILGGNFSTPTVASDFYYLDIDINGIPVAAYDPSIYDIPDTSLYDTVGTNHGTLVNFPADGTARILYGEDEEDIRTGVLNVAASPVATLAGYKLALGDVNASATPVATLSGYKIALGIVSPSANQSAILAGYKIAQGSVSPVANANATLSGYKYALGTFNVSANATATIEGTTVEFDIRTGALNVAASPVATLAGYKLAIGALAINANPLANISGHKTALGTFTIQASPQVQLVAFKTAFGALHVAANTVVTLRGGAGELETHVNQIFIQGIRQSTVINAVKQATFLRGYI